MSAAPQKELSLLPKHAGQIGQAAKCEAPQPGTRAGYCWHMRPNHKERRPACNACNEAQLEYQRAYQDTLSNEIKRRYNKRKRAS